MAKYVMKYRFEWGGTCLWSANDAAKAEYGYDVDEQKLPISRKLKDLLRYLQAYHDTMMDMDNTPDDSPWWTEDDGENRNSPTNSSALNRAKTMRSFGVRINDKKCGDLKCGKTANQCPNLQRIRSAERSGSGW